MGNTRMQSIPSKCRLVDNDPFASLPLRVMTYISNYIQLQDEMLLARTNRRSSAMLPVFRVMMAAERHAEISNAKVAQRTLFIGLWYQDIVRNLAETVGNAKSLLTTTRPDSFEAANDSRGIEKT